MQTIERSPEKERDRQFEDLIGDVTNILNNAEAKNLDSKQQEARLVAQARAFRDALRALEKEQVVVSLMKYLEQADKLLTCSGPQIIGTWSDQVYKYRGVGAVVLTKNGFDYAVALQMEGGLAGTWHESISTGGLSFPWSIDYHRKSRDIDDFAPTGFTQNDKHSQPFMSALAGMAHRTYIPTKDLVRYAQNEGKLEIGAVRESITRYIDEVARKFLLNA